MKAIVATLLVMTGCYVHAGDSANRARALATRMQIAGFQEALEKIQAAARRHDVATGIMVATAEQANRRAEQGFQMIALAAEVRLFSAAISQLIAQLKRP